MRQKTVSTETGFGVIIVIVALLIVAYLTMSQSNSLIGTSATDPSNPASPKAVKTRVNDVTGELKEKTESSANELLEE